MRYASVSIFDAGMGIDPIPANPPVSAPTEIRPDDSFKVYSTPEEAEEGLKEREEHTVRMYGIPVKTIRFHSFLSSEEWMTPADEHTAGLTGTNLFIENEGKKIGLRECAMPSVYQRLGVFGTGLSRLTRPDLVKVFEMLRKTAPGKVDLVIVDGKVNFLASSNGTKNSYCHLPAETIFRLVNELVERDGGSEDFTASESYSTFISEWKGTSNLELGGKDYDVNMTLFTSEVGEGSVTIVADLKPENGPKIPAMSPVRVAHKNEATLQEVKSAMLMVNAALTKGVAALKLLKDVKIHNPKGCIKRVAKRIGLPKPATLAVVEEFFKNHSTVEANALELYMALCQVPDKVVRKDKFQEYKLMTDIRKAMFVNWESFDLPGDFAW